MIRWFDEMLVSAVYFGQDQLGLVRFSSVWLSSARFGSFRSILVY